MSQDTLIDEHVEHVVAVLTAEHSQWVRAVAWVGRLQDSAGTPAEGDIYLNRVLCWEDGEVVTKYYTGVDDYDAYLAISQMTCDVDWTQFRLVADRDGGRQVEFVTNERRRQVEGSATDPYWHQVDDYLELNREEVDALVDRLRDSGDLPGEKKTSGRGLLSYFRPGT
ncbi:hypothetical protein AVL62_15350 [Serinicoccus chungangensis]|uniref:Uncharacterized protein n=1 Tax=Serinicoccus chungangensis TaxID=767452 RepID=A0A0W8IB95_9MICO|nr:hypothetical protein [Serinicoccus chungangensis]KUG57160.1 hypothetical protein AVL62_15350 [Serinicoccus chungangensis]